jgi:excisionase family DNA binding protein
MVITLAPGQLVPPKESAPGGAEATRRCPLDTTPRLCLHRRLDPATPAQIGIESHYPFNVTEPWVSAGVIAEHLGVTKDSIYTWIATKDMPAHRVGRLWKFKVTEVDAWVRRVSADETSGNDGR